ncbi:MAG: 16S rRNA processing protein RimM [Vallitaleaceae bacterium]|nr:16S rRNA processing protein RimM [Vallitaleaceae bacterium]
MEYITIGKVATTHGVRGELKIFPTTDDITRFELLKEVFVDNGKVTKTLTITGIKYFKNMVILQSKELKNMDEALELKGGSLLIPMKEALPLEENENYIFQLIGLMAKDETGEDLGKVVDVLHTGSHDVYVIEDGSKHGLMVPAVKEFVLDVNVEQGYLTVRLIEGLKGL